MSKYEVLYIIDNDVADEKKNEIVARFSDLVEANGGKILAIDKWGTRKYAYKINFKSEGYYVLMTFEADGAFIAELERQMRNNESIVRELVTLCE
jgi:small subunit ribosomal protein S6